MVIHKLMVRIGASQVDRASFPPLICLLSVMLCMQQLKRIFLVLNTLTVLWTVMYTDTLTIVQV